jgi:hypothetical protein
MQEKIFYAEFGSLSEQRKTLIRKVYVFGKTLKKVFCKYFFNFDFHGFTEK